MHDPEDRIFEAKIVVTVMGEAEDAGSFGAEIAGMSLSEVERTINNGEMIGSVGRPLVEQIETDQVANCLEDLGNDGAFFDLADDEAYPKGAEREEPAGRILRAQMAQGWSTETLEALGRDFIEQAGLSAAYAAFLEAHADEESEMSADPDGGMMQ